MNFFGRDYELKLLQRFVSKKTASLLVITGRRRIGKSRLIEEFAKPYKFYHFSGVAPNQNTTLQSQLDEFARQLSRHDVPKVKAEDWNDLFWLLADKTKQGRVVVLFDEISWLGSQDPDFLGKLKNAWDLHYSKNPALILILCGSSSAWIAKNILSSTGFVGRVSLALTVEELPLRDCQNFWGRQGENISIMEKMKLLAVTGGVPRYLEEINPSLSAEDNIKNMCFTKGALLVDEFEHIFSNIFLRKSTEYKKIIEVLAVGSKEFKELCQLLAVDMSGRQLEYLEELILSGFIKREYSWHLKNGQDAKLSKFRLSDNYLRFYLKYIKKYKTKIEKNSFQLKSLSSLPGWDTMLALQFENLVLNNRNYIWQQLNLDTAEIVAENPFFQRKNTSQLGCQIDYLIQTKFGSLYVCEIKFSKNKISPSIIQELQEKISRIKQPKWLSCRPVLIHINGVEDRVIESDYFAAIIDFGKIMA